MMIAIELEESDRQMVLCALARLSLARPGWEIALHQIALKMDNVVDGRAEMFHQFRNLGHTGERPHVVRALQMFDGAASLPPLERPYAGVPTTTGLDDWLLRNVVLKPDDDGLPAALDGFDKLKIGPAMLEPGERLTVTLEAKETFRASDFCVPFWVVGLELLELNVAKLEILVKGKTTPIEIFSQWNTFPKLLWPTFEPGDYVSFVLRNPTNERREFRGAFYGVKA